MHWMKLPKPHPQNTAYYIIPCKSQLDSSIPPNKTDSQLIKINWNLYAKINTQMRSPYTVALHWNLYHNNIEISIIMEPAGFLARYTLAWHTNKWATLYRYHGLYLKTTASKYIYWRSSRNQADTSLHKGEIGQALL